MSLKDSRPVRVLVTALAAVALGVMLSSAAGPANAAKPAPTSTNGCPSGGTYLVDPEVGATSTGTATRTYTFSSWVPNTGVPGLIGYCVYTDQTPTDLTAVYDFWKASKLGQSFSFTRPNGEKSNIPFDGTTVTVGTATFGTEPSTESILLHISDAATCQALYGGDATTCYVKPAPKPGPVCDAASGDTGAAYDAYPKDVLGCGPPSYAFEGNSVTEFGDKVTLAATGTLQSLKVVFNSYGCGVSGKWDAGNCVTTAGQTFTIPGGITARIYDASDLTTPLATATINPNIPFRPSAIPDSSCPNALESGYPANSRYLNPASGLCEYSAKLLLTFTSWSSTPTLPSNVVWTVAFNTTHHGNPTPIGESAPCFGVGGGCGYDSLNVGTKSYTNAPYAGIDLVETEAVRRVDAGTLGLFTIGTDQRPLGEIITG